MHGLVGKGVIRVRAALRAEPPLVAGVDENAIVGDIGGNGSWVAALRDVDSVVHPAAKAHVVRGAHEFAL